MPFNKHPIFVNKPDRVLTKKINQQLDDNGNVISFVSLVDENSKVPKSSDYTDYSLLNQINSGNTLKQVKTTILEDNFDSITTDMVEPYFEKFEDD